MGAYTGVSNCFNEPLVDIAISLNYSPANILILEGNEAALVRDHKQIYENLLSCKHQRDGRTLIEYGRDLIASWIFEDFLVKELNESAQFSIELNGADKTREILANSKTSTSSDYLIHINDQDIILELMCDYTGFWNRKKKMHLRDDKYLQMERNNSLFLAVSTLDKAFALIDFHGDVPAKYINYHYPYGKPAYEVNLSDIVFYELTSTNLIAEIENSIVTND